MLQAVVTRYPVKVITPSFMLQAQIEPVGTLLDYLNDTNRASVPFVEVTLYDLSGRLKPTQHPLVVVKKQDICGLHTDDRSAGENIRLLRRVEKLIVHVPHLVCRGEIHLGSETRLQDALEVLNGSFFALTSVTIFPVTSLPAEFPQKTDLFLAHKDVVQAYYSE